MKKFYWLLIITSAIAYGFSFLLSEYLWWLTFVFPIPLLYLTRTAGLSFMHGYVWGVVVFALHLSGGISVIACMAHESWAIGVAIGVVMVLYQAYLPGVLFWCAAYINRVFSVQSSMVCLFVWTLAIWLFIVWTDWYSMWIFGIQEGYPLMHPLILLAQKPYLLCLLPIIGKQLLTGLLLLVSVSGVLLLWHKTYKTLLFFCSAMAPWLLCWWVGEPEFGQICWQTRVKTLPYMVCSVAKNPIIAVKIVRNQLKNIITKYPETEVIIMPESAFNVSNFADLPELVQLWNSDYMGKPIHFIFGASRWHKGNYYNSLHWVYNGVLQNCCDKRHAMLISERLSGWMDSVIMQQLYFSQRSPVTISCDERIKLSLSESLEFVPYICSELFFNELPDDAYGDIPIIAIINDSLFLGSTYSLYIQKLLVLLARYKAIQWQRDIVYVSYAQSLFIDKYGNTKNINE